MANHARFVTSRRDAASRPAATDQHVVRLVCAALAIALGTLSMRIAGLW